MSTIGKTFEVDGVLTDMTSVVLSDITGTFGVKRNDTNAVVVADGTAMTNTAVGVYQHTFADPAFGLIYTYAFEIVYAGETYWIEGTLVGPLADLSTYALTTVANARDYLSVAAGHTELITRLINAATDRIEKYCGRQFRARDYSEWYDGTGSNELYLPEYPIQTVGRVATSEVPAMSIRCDAADATEAFVAVTTAAVELHIPDGVSAATTTATFAVSATFSAMKTLIEATAGSWTVELQSAAFTSFQTTLLRPVGRQFCFEGAALLAMPDEAEADYRVDYENGVIMLHGGAFGRGRRNVYVEYNAGDTGYPADLEQMCLQLMKIWYDAHEHDGALESERLETYAYKVADGGAAGGIGDSGLPKIIEGLLNSYREIGIG